MGEWVFRMLLHAPEFDVSQTESVTETSGFVNLTRLSAREIFTELTGLYSAFLSLEDLPTCLIYLTQ